MNYFCIEILGESPFHPLLIQSGWSGKDYVFFYNAPTQSHLRAYRRLEDYLLERVDMHKAVNIWPLLANLLPEENVTLRALVGEPLAKEMEMKCEQVVKRGGRTSAKASCKEAQ